MLIADAIGIVIGIVMGRHITERAVKWGAAIVFFGFPVFGKHQNVPERFSTQVVKAVSLLTIGVSGYLLARSSQKTPVQELEG